MQPYNIRNIFTNKLAETVKRRHLKNNINVLKKTHEEIAKWTLNLSRTTCGQLFAFH